MGCESQVGFSTGAYLRLHDDLRRASPWWMTESETFSPPPNNVQAKWSAGVTALKLAYGVTTVVESCSKCGKRRAFTVAGRAAAAS
jgi:hypothetical protein